MPFIGKENVTELCGDGEGEGKWNVDKKIGASLFLCKDDCGHVSYVVIFRL
jgi:hypothetical protein